MARVDTITEIFRPTPAKVLLAIIVAAFAHLFLVVAELRQAGEDLALVREFWATNLINALPYLETRSMPLKFLTFFLLSYALVWLLSKGFRFLDNLQVALTKQLRKRS